MLQIFTGVSGKIIAALLLALHALCLVECTEEPCAEVCTEQCSEESCAEPCEHDEPAQAHDAQQTCPDGDCGAAGHGCICHIQITVSNTAIGSNLAEIPDLRFFLISDDALPLNSRNPVFRPPIA